MRSVLQQSKVPGPPERISVDLLKSYIGSVLSGSYDAQEHAEDDADVDIGPYLDDAIARARSEGALKALGAGVHLLLTTPGLDLEALSSVHFPADDAEMRDILSQLRDRLLTSQPDLHGTPGAGEATAVLDWQEPGIDWLVRHGRLHVVRAGETLRSIAAQHGLPVDELLERNPYHRAHYGPDNILRGRPGETVVWLKRHEALR